MSRTIHVSITCDYAEQELKRQIQKNEPQHIWVHEDGCALSYSEAFKVIENARAKGYECVPPCENVRPDGGCAGHEE